MPLLEEDEVYLSSKGFNYDITNQPGEVHLIIHNFPLPDIYSVSNVDLLIRLPAGYPNAHPDMFWTIPTVSLKNGVLPTAAAQMEVHGGKTWQRWSRHWQNHWRPGIDGLHTFITAVKHELSKGI